VPALTELRPAPGVWHLVSTVAGTLRPDVGDGDLLRATFPPGSVTGAPKIQTMRVIAELEATAREAYGVVFASGRTYVVLLERFLAIGRFDHYLVDAHASHLPIPFSLRQDRRPADRYHPPSAWDRPGTQPP
jgi:hypothetical protein